MTIRPENTRRTDPLLHILDAMMMGPSGAIEAQEKRGQQQLVHSDVLPTDTRGTDADFLALGFTFGEPLADDDIFRPATLPEGWTRRGSDHSMWSYLMDARGIERVAVFYKAAHYDRSAHMMLHNVGRRVAGQAVWGDKPLTADDLHLARLTADERAELMAALADERARENEVVVAEWATDDMKERSRTKLARVAACEKLVAAHAEVAG